MASFDPNPLKELLLDEGASLMPYGIEPPEPGTVRAEPAEPSPDVPLLAAAFGPIELEYASLRRDCVIIDRPDRAVIEVSGFDSREFLSRMLTQDVGSLEPGQSCNSFWLNRKGRIDADLRVTRWERDGDDGDVYFLGVEAPSVDATVRSLSAYVITEEVCFTVRTRAHQLPDVPSRRDSPNTTWHRMSLHGPKSVDLLFAATAPDLDERVFSIEPNRALRLPIGQFPAWIDRHDTAGVPGFELLVRHEDAADVYRTLVRFGRPDEMSPAARFEAPEERGEAIATGRAVRSATAFARPQTIRLRPAGWFAYNIARIEAGTPLFKIDFGPDNLPAETGVLNDRVNFKKGCYLGQEVVARMHARGHPKQQLVALRFDDDLPPGPDGLPPLPVQGDRVFAAASASAPTETPDGSTPTPPAEPKPIGSITSSTFSPMLGRIPIAFAMLAWAHIAPGTRVEVETDNRRIGGVVQDGLRFVP
ncbi:MAG: aminomethyl transferase family protein [Phycisphaeraceae bacterium]|nr:aminomethyl transferase family protein [Phycisphaeraceae bacterium]